MIVHGVVLDVDDEGQLLVDDGTTTVMITAGDVIHSWMVPELGVKQDGIPGFIRNTWFRADKIGEYLSVALGEISRLDYIITGFLQKMRPRKKQITRHFVDLILHIRPWRGSATGRTVPPLPPRSA